MTSLPRIKVNAALTNVEVELVSDKVNGIAETGKCIRVSDPCRGFSAKVACYFYGKHSERNLGSNIYEVNPDEAMRFVNAYIEGFVVARFESLTDVLSEKEVKPTLVAPVLPAPKKAIQAATPRPTKKTVLHDGTTVAKMELPMGRPSGEREEEIKDTIKHFADTKLVRGGEGTSQSDIHRAYEKYCRNKSIPSTGKDTLSKKLVALGYVSRQPGREWIFDVSLV